MSEFSDRVYNVIKKIPKGRVMTYSEVAKKAGSPKAVRAVGNILNKNFELVTVPCHRVICSDGGVGGYARGEKRKIGLLKSEGVGIKAGRVLV